MRRQAGFREAGVSCGIVAQRHRPEQPHRRNSFVISAGGFPSIDFHAAEFVRAEFRLCRPDALFVVGHRCPNDQRAMGRGTGYAQANCFVHEGRIGRNFDLDGRKRGFRGFDGRPRRACKSIYSTVRRMDCSAAILALLGNGLHLHGVVDRVVCATGAGGCRTVGKYAITRGGCFHFVGVTVAPRFGHGKCAT